MPYSSFDFIVQIDGGISYCRYGEGNQRPALIEPIEDRVFFAGEACSPDAPGTAHGAWLSGGIAIERIESTSASRCPAASVHHSLAFGHGDSGW